MSEVDYIAVGRAAHELGERHGRRAHLHAAKLAREAKSKKRIDESEFWEAVSASLKPREQ